MKKALVFLAVLVLAGCGRPPVPVFNAEKVADGKADELAANNWGKVEYAPKQYAGFVYDSTGLYGNLHGVGAPEIVSLWFHASKDHKGIARRRICLFVEQLTWSPACTSGSDVIHATPPPGLSEGHFKWLGQPGLVKQGFVYRKTFWISWKAFGLDGPPAEGKLRVSIHAMQRKGTGASFLVDADSRL